MSSRRPTILLNPGPVTLTERVRGALLREDQCHREADFAELVQGIRSRLSAVYGTGAAHEPILLGGSGTCAVEALLASLVPRDGKLLVVANGNYGERMAAMVRAHGKEHVEARAGWLEPLPLERVEEVLAADRSVTHVAAVHDETTTGRRNDLQALARLCRARELPLLVDAVSSFGGEAIEPEDWGIQGLAATANKCLHGVPGVSFVLVRRSALAAIAANAPSLYLDLAGYRGQVESGFSPFTPPVHACFALEEALDELADQGGWRARRARYRALSNRVAAGLAELGVEGLLEAGASSASLRAYRLPAGWSYPRLHDALRRAGFVIYAGQGELARSIFRVAVMGDVRDEDIDRLLDAFTDALGR